MQEQNKDVEGFEKEKSPSQLTKNLEKQNEQLRIFQPFQQIFQRKWTRQEHFLISLFQKIEENQMKIQEIDQALEHSYKNLEKYTGSIEPIRSPYQMSIKKEQQQNQSEDLVFLHKLFGRKDYRYLLTPSTYLPNTLYKERNFDIKVKLTDLNEGTIRNSNVLHLCLGICTTQAQWITENKVGSEILKGKTEVQLYEGVANFTKIYIRDISRNYPTGRVNLVVYCKPSVLLYPANISYQQYVPFEEIKPLLLESIKVKAKKKD